MAQKGKKAELWISAVLYLLIISIVMSIVLQAGLPMLKNLRDKSIVLQTRDNFINLDRHIQEIADAGPGSQRVVPFEIKKGDLKVEDGRVLWEFDTEAEIMQPGSSQKSGNLRLGLNADVRASEQSDRYTLQNSYIKAVFSKIGNASSFRPINTSGIVKYMEFVETGGQANDTFTFEITSSGTAISSGNGYTALLETGNDLDKGTMQFHINYTSGSSNAENDVFISLHANEDFLRVWVE